MVVNIIQSYHFLHFHYLSKKYDIWVNLVTKNCWTRIEIKNGQNSIHTSEVGMSSQEKKEKHVSWADDSSPPLSEDTADQESKDKSGGEALPKKKSEEKDTVVKSLKEVMSRRRKEQKERQSAASSSLSLYDPYENSMASNFITRGLTAIAYDPEVGKHKCEWDEMYPEKPERVAVIISRLLELRLYNHCIEIPPLMRADIYDRVILKHSVEHFNRLKTLCQTGSVTSLEFEATKFDSIFINNLTYESACRALSAVLNLVLSIAQSDYLNGFAVVRPPGHHAMHEAYNGYCFFNNVAIAAESCIQDGLSRKVLIVDIDVHHGQGTQQMFYDRKDVLYFSIHRYEHGLFWPNLLESNYNYIGKGNGVGYNINVPLNTTGLGDDDYMAVVLYILLPVAYEFNPDLVIISGGYDAAIGCPEGKMMVTPGFYAHLVTLLHGLARGKIGVVLEGGYFLPSLAEGVALTVKSLLGGPCPILEPVNNVKPCVVEVIRNVRRMLYDYWKCFQVCEFVNEEGLAPNAEENVFKICYFGEPEQPPYQTRHCYPENSYIENLYYTQLCQALTEKYKASSSLVMYVYDEVMLKHAPKHGEVERPERPERLTTVMKTLEEFGLLTRMVRIPIVKRDFSAYSPHVPDYVATIRPGLQESKDIYVNEFTNDAVITATCGVLTLVDNVMKGVARSGMAIVRPPGHHAERGTPGGFCFVNNIAVAANYAKMKYNVQRILIVDFDVHHGNGTQNMFYQSSNVMYISIHRDEDGKFFPLNSPRGFRFDGNGPGKGFNMNIPFNKDKMGDTEYLAAFINIVVPAAYSFAPQLILVSAGFDAGINDPLGGYNVSPETFGHFITMLKPLAEGRLILALEGGYNLTTTSYAMAICAKALLGDPIVMPKDVYKNCSESAIQTIRDVGNHFKQYHPIFAVNQKLPNNPAIVKKVSHVTAETYNGSMFKLLNPDKVADNEYVEDEMSSFNKMGSVAN